MKKYVISLFVALFFSLGSAQADHIIVDEWEYIPNLSLSVEKDNVSGWNLHIMSENFVFDPANAGQVNQVGHGHAHLYINNKKVARVYSNWFHLPADLFVKGMNTIKVSLNANGHEAFYYRNTPIFAEIMVHFDGQIPDGHDHGHHHGH